MTGERLPSVDIGFTLAEQLLSNRDTLHELRAGGKDKETILQNIVSKLDHDIVAQSFFLETLVQNIAVEGEFDVTNRRDRALAILTDTAKDGRVRVTKVMEPLVKSRSATVYRAYIEAVRQQTKENDPISGSIDTLLDLGSAL